MRVYAELAEIRDACGDKKEAISTAKWFGAIAFDSDRDEFYAAGEARHRDGETALNHFADAYRIRSRLQMVQTLYG